MSLNVALVNYKKSLQYDLKDKNITSTKMSVTIENGSTLIELSETANILFGKLLALEYLINIGMNVVGIFITLNIFKAFSTFEYPVIILSTMSFLLLLDIP